MHRIRAYVHTEISPPVLRKGEHEPQEFGKADVGPARLPEEVLQLRDLFGYE
jgi:hypothetical protein